MARIALFMDMSIDRMRASIFAFCFLIVGTLFTPYSMATNLCVNVFALNDAITFSPSSPPPEAHIGYYLKQRAPLRASFSDTNFSDIYQNQWIKFESEPAYILVKSTNAQEKTFTAQDPIRLRKFFVLTTKKGIDVQEIPIHSSQFRRGNVDYIRSAKRTFAWKVKDAKETVKSLFTEQQNITGDIFEERSDYEKSNIHLAITKAVDTLYSNSRFTDADLEEINLLLNVGDHRIEKFDFPDELKGYGVIRGNSTKRFFSFNIRYKKNTVPGERAWIETDGKPTGVWVDLERTEMTNHSPGLHYIPAKDVPIALKDWLENFNHVDSKTSLLKIANLYQNFILIHPFTDGNGRLSRILLDMMLLKAGFNGVKHTATDTRSTIYTSEEDIAERISSNLI